MITTQHTISLIIISMKKFLNRFLRIPYYLHYFYYKYFIYNENFLTKSQNALYKIIDFSREMGHSRLNTLCLQLFNEAYDEDQGMFSEHLILLACLSIKNDKTDSIKEILEIGTYDGKTAFLLSKLFPNAVITTIDLEDSSEDLLNTYQRASYLKDFIAKRNALLKNGENIKFVQMNSMNLINVEDSKYDLIWIDGAHGYPVVTSDIVNALRLSKIGGHILVDDVIIKSKKNDAIYRSIAAHETLISLKKAGLVSKFLLFNKRLSSKYNFRPKFVAYFNKERS